VLEITRCLGMSYAEGLSVPWEMVLRLLLAALCGTLVGLDREANDKPAGVRTFALVSLGSAAFACLTLMLYQSDADRSSDPIRLINGLIGGIGFLGAGAIIQGQNNVRGLTTASGIWIVGAIGAACGLGHYWLALLTTALTLIILCLVGRVEKTLKRKIKEG